MRSTTQGCPPADSGTVVPDELQVVDVPVVCDELQVIDAPVVVDTPMALPGAHSSAEEGAAQPQGGAMRRYRSPLGDHREAPVPCWACRRPTFALDATCDGCHRALRSSRVA